MGFKFNPIYGTLDLVGNSSSGSGDVVGPASATDKAIARYDGTTGKLIQNSLAIIQDGGAIETQGIIQKRNIDNDVTVPDDYTWITQDLNLKNGTVTCEGDGEITLVD